MKVDLHVHSCYSHDSRTSLDELVARCKEQQLDQIALTDHNTAEGSLKLQHLYPDLVIVAEEVKTTEGEIIGLFIPHSLAPNRTPEETIDEIHALGGLAMVPHPFDLWRPHFSRERIRALADRLDIIETYNSWSERSVNDAAEEIAKELNKPMAFGSDAHMAKDLGHCWQEMRGFASPQEFLVNLTEATRERTWRWW